MKWLMKIAMKKIVGKITYNSNI